MNNCVIYYILLTEYCILDITMIVADACFTRLEKKKNKKNNLNGSKAKRISEWA